MSSLGIVPVRYQSTRLPNKTFMMLCGKPLIQWTIDVAKKSNLDDILVVTSSREVLDYCCEHHIMTTIRPVGLEGDRAPIIDTIRWLNDSSYNSEYDVQMLLQVTNPTRTVEDIDSCLNLINAKTVSSVCSVVEVGEYHPQRMFKPAMGLGLEPYTKLDQWIATQDLPKVFLRDGSIYCWKTKAFERLHGNTLLPDLLVRYEVEIERSVRVDTMWDLRRAEFYLTSLEPLVS